MPTGGARRILLFRNGDTTKPPLEYAYSPAKTHTFDRLLEDIDSTVTPRAQNYGRAAVGTKKLFTHEGLQIRDLVGLDECPENYFVVAGNEAFTHVVGGYTAILDRAAAPQTPKPWQTLLGDNRSYMDLNKEKYGGASDREENQKLVNRLPKPKVMRFIVKHNEDQAFGTKPYIWRQKQTPTFEALCRDLDRMAPSNPEGQALRQLIRESDDHACTNVGDIIDGETYIVVHTDEHRPTKRRPAAQRQHHTASENDFDHGGGADYGDDDGRDVYYSADDDELDNEQYSARYGRPQWHKSAPDEEVDWEAIRAKDELMMRTHYSKAALYANVPSRLDRGGHMNAGDKRLFVFANGQGEQPRIVLLTKAQQARGMNWVLERFSVPFRVNGKRIATMDGATVASVEEMVNCGAYVVVPMGETFRHAWYYLPALAIDTSKEAENGGLSTAMKDRGREDNGYGNRDEAATRSNYGAAPPQRHFFTPRKPNRDQHSPQRSRSLSGRTDEGSRRHHDTQNDRRGHDTQNSRRHHDSPNERGHHDAPSGQRHHDALSNQRQPGMNDRKRTVPNAGAGAPLPPIDRQRGDALVHEQRRSARKPLPYQNNVYKSLHSMSASTKSGTAPESQRRRDSWGDVVGGGGGGKQNMSRSTNGAGGGARRQSARNQDYRQKLQLERSYSEFDIKQQKPKRGYSLGEKSFKF